MTKTLANGYPSESARQELPNEYQQSWVSVVFKDFSHFSALDIERVNPYNAETILSLKAHARTNF